MEMMTCDECHQGNPLEQDDMEAAHEDFVPDPSAPAAGVCYDCHPGVGKTFVNSMHATLQGERAVVALRYGMDSFEECPSSLKDGYNGECTSCHATCGDCHISRPNTAGQGFIKNHVFSAKPSQRYQCMGCHGGRIGEDYMGSEDEGRSPDTHFISGMDCMDCHDGEEMHAEAGDAKNRWEAPHLPQCEDCHGDDEDANVYHTVHWDDMSCYVCHSQPYSNCAGCHVNGEYHHDEEYNANNPFKDLKIGKNFLENRRFKYGLLRHAPMAPDTFDPWGAPRPESYDALPTWKYTAPHSIQRWTTRTKVTAGSECGANCHLGAPGGKAENATFYLFEADVQEELPNEVGANLPVVVDEILPESWK